MDEILYHLGALNYCKSGDFRDLEWCKISSIDSMCLCPLHRVNSLKGGYIGII